MTTEFKAISLHQPWASAMALFLKRNETRSRLIRYRGDLVICSTLKRPSPEDLELLNYFPYGESAKIRYGVAICIVEVYDCITSVAAMEDKANPISPEEYAFGNYSPVRFVWKTRNVRRFKTPIPVKGGQFIFNLHIEPNFLQFV